MNPIVFLCALWLFAGCEVGLKSMFQVGSTGIAPSFLVVLLVFVSMWASTTGALAGALVIGLVLDLITGVHTASDLTTVVVGPHVLGCSGAAYVVLSLRAMMFRKSVLAIGAVSLMASLLIAVVVVFLMTIRSMIDSEILYGSPIGALGQGVLAAILTGLLALPLGWVLQLTRPLFGFRDPGGSLPLAGSARR